MRDIKFRAIDKKTGDFVYGFLSYADFALIIVEPIDIPPSMSEPGGDHITEWYQIKSETIGQYTGLKDKNGKAIYEADIIRITSLKAQIQNIELIGEVVFGGGAGCYRVDKIKEVKWEKFSALVESPSYIWFLNFGNKEIEIIGNIYENPELLEVNER